MANNLGSLVVSLGLNASEFTAGLTKSEYQARQFGRTMDRAVASGVIKAEIAIRALGAAARATFDVFQSLTTGAGQFQDLAEETGAAAVDLASLAVSAATAGVEMTSVGAAANKLTKSLVGVDDESKAAGAALKSLNINIDDFKKLDPVAQYEAVGKALGRYADGAEKTAVAQALFGKSGAEQLKVFKAMEEAGGRQTILTQRQIELADQYQDMQAKATAELRLYAQAATSEVLPALIDVTKAVIDFVKEIAGLDGQIKTLTGNSRLKDFAQEVQQLFGGPKAASSLVSEIDTTERKLKALLELRGKGYTVVGFFGSEQEREKEIKSYQAQIVKAQTELIGRTRNLTGERLNATTDPRSLTFGVKDSRPRLNFAGAVRPAKEKKDAADKISEAERYIESLQRQLRTTQQLSEVEKVAAEAQSGRLEKATAAQIDMANGIAIQIDAQNLLADTMKDAEEANKAWVKAQLDGIESSKKARESVEAENQALTDEIAIITGGEEARRAIEQARISSAIATREQAKALRELEGASVVELENLDAEIAKLRERQGLLGQRNVATDQADAMRKQMDESERQINAAKAPFEDQFTQLLDGTKTAKEALNDFTKSWMHNLNTMAAQSLSDAIFGKRGANGQMQSGWLDQFFGGMAGSSSGGAASAGSGNWLSTAGTFLAGLFGGGKAIGGPTLPNTLYRVGERNAEVFDDGSGQYLLTGSRRGHIDSNPRMGGGRTMNVSNTFVMQGPVDRRTQNQVASAAARSLAAANARFN